MRRRACAHAVVLALFLCAAGSETGLTQVVHTTGQNVQPVFEGWERRPDGGFDLVFGYLNRNYAEEPEVPVGPLNAFSPGPADRGQPTHFYPRRQSFVFRVTVPADWDEKRDLVWTVTHNGGTSAAYGSLWPVWELDEGVWKANRGSGIAGRTSKQFAPNQPPVIVVADSTLMLDQTSSATLTVTVSDDGKPGASPSGRGRAQASQPQLTAVPGLSSGSGANPQSQDLVRSRDARETGLAVTWIHYRGAGTVTFEPRVVPIASEGQALAASATTTARFSEAGTYVVRAVADDTIYTTPVDVTVVVKSDAAGRVER